VLLFELNYLFEWSTSAASDSDYELLIEREGSASSSEPFKSAASETTYYCALGGDSGFGALIKEGLRARGLCPTAPIDSELVGLQTSI